MSKKKSAVNEISKSVTRNDIIEYITQSSKDQIYKKFVQHLYYYLPSSYLSNESHKSLASIAEDLYNFTKCRTQKEYMLSCQHHKSAANGGVVDIMIVSDDRPFVVDSIELLLSENKLNYQYLIHPAMPIKRNKKSEIESIKEGENSELILFLRLTNISDKDLINKIKQDLRDVLELAHVTYKSWHPIVHELDSVSQEFLGEVVLHDFLKWILDDHFTFLGYTKLDKDNNVISQIGDERICSFKVNDNFPDGDNMILGQMNQISKIHRNSFIDYFGLKIGEYKYFFFGLYSSAIYQMPVNTIPFLKQKISYVVDHSEFAAGGHNAKKLKYILSYMPREILFNTHKENLYQASIRILSSMVTKDICCFINLCNQVDFISVLICMPTDRITPDVLGTIRNHISALFEEKISYDYMSNINKHFSYMYITMAATKKVKKVRESELEAELEIISASWSEALKKYLDKTCSKEEYFALEKYDDIFSKDYHHKHKDFAVVKADIEHIRELDNKSFLCKLHNMSEQNYKLKIYSTQKETLSDLVPIIENLGFKAINEHTFDIKYHNEERWIFEFNLYAEHDNALADTKHNVETALHKIKEGVLHSDSLSKLIVLAGLEWRHVFILKALTRYLHQTAFPYGKGYVQLVLIKHYDFVQKLMGYFEAKFNPKKLLRNKLDKLEKGLEIYLAEVTSSAEDKVLRAMMSIFTAIIRTNCYQNKPYLSFKFNSSLIPNLPSPVPYAEIYVFGIDFEGIHLRGGMVARGGLRWSDRSEDYRTEVLGLMKAQMPKNAVIVPVGSKGGFCIKYSPADMSRSDYLAKGIECYKQFLSGLLDITDNMVNNKIVPPKDVVRYDGDDPYLVVAADKGTATFSDYANQISKEYDFWLNDAFASGGSDGYDHKKMGITARGAWISVQHHFHSMGVNVQQDSVRVLGIGDMSGDVFGNGMLLSKSIKLVAAFNHLHIFIDPNPNPEISYEERKRLFNLSGSKWSDYKSELISKGGGVFSRSAKVIKLTPEIKEMISSKADELEPDNLIHELLKAELDLIWNGGIGTYIKASTETDLEIGDKVNDNLRVNAKDLKTKVIGEGGNLGISQRGRIEFAQQGGKINADFIDNSAGVDCSDHEVNIKIALNQALLSGKINLSERNKILSKMQKAVADLVLLDNHKQSQAITITEKSSAFTVEMFSKLIDLLESEGLLNREVEFLPSRAELARRVSTDEKLTRPELALILSYSKMTVYDELLSASLAKDQYSQHFLTEYFPQYMQENFADEIKNHPLKNEIIITSITNKMINQLGSPTISSISRETGAKLCDIVRSYMIVNDIFEIDNIWQKVDKLSNDISTDVKIEMYTSLGKLLRRSISWFLSNLSHPINIDEAIKYYNKPARELSALLNKYLVGDIKEKYQEKIEYYRDHYVDEKFAREMAMVEFVVSVFDIIYVSSKHNANTEEVAKTYYETSEYFDIEWLRRCAENQIDESFWNRLTIQTLKDDLYDKQRRLVQVIVRDTKKRGDINSWYKQNAVHARMFKSFITELKEQELVSLNMVVLANKKLEAFIRKLS